MSTQDDVRRVARALPEVVEATDRFAFSVLNGTKLRGFAWAWRERIEPGKPRVENPDVLVLRVADGGVKALLLGSDPRRFFTEPHYHGYPAVLVRLGAVETGDLEDLLLDAWACMAPRRLVRALEERLGGSPVS
ncbi:MAG: MmcQ/YjbR family DNA-binding protein [Rhodomicrobium sp.]